MEVGAGKTLAVALKPVERICLVKLEEEEEEVERINGRTTKKYIC